MSKIIMTGQSLTKFDSRVGALLGLGCRSAYPSSGRRNFRYSLLSAISKNLVPIWHSSFQPDSSWYMRYFSTASGDDPIDPETLTYIRSPKCDS